jgi:hypothetical protein
MSILSKMFYSTLAPFEVSCCLSVGHVLTLPTIWHSTGESSMVTIEEDSTQSTC